MASTSKSVMPQLSMYPKDLVYPSGGGEIQLEMIRAEWPVYKRKFIFTEPEDNGVCDMDMTEACFGNITLNIPVLSSVEKGMRVNVMQETGQGSCRVPLKVTHEEVDEELFKLCQDKENLTSVPPHTRKETVRTKEDKKVLDIEQEFQQLMLERECEQQQEQLYSCQEEKREMDFCGLSNKENEIPKQNKPLFHFTPSGNDESSLAGWHGNSLTGTRLNFSEAESTSLSVCNNDKSTQGRGQSKLHAVLDCEQKAHLTKEQQMFEEQFINGYTEMELKRENVDYSSCSIANFSHATDPSSFSVFEDQSSLALSKHSFGSTVFQKETSQRKPFDVIQKDSAHNSMGVSQSVVESFSVYEDSSMSSFTGRDTKKHRNIPNISQSRVDSFSVYEDPSLTSFTGQGTRNQRNSVGVSQSQSRVESFSVYKDPSQISISEEPELRNIRGETTTSHSVTESFSVFEDPSITGSCQPMSRNKDGRKALGSIIMTRGPSSNSYAMGMSQNAPESFSVFEDPSQLSISERSRVDRNVPQNTRTAPSGSMIKSFSVYEDPSQQSINVAANPSASSNHKPLYERPLPSFSETPKQISKAPLQPSTPEYEPEPPGFTEFELPSRYEPTSTPSGKRIGLDMSVELTMIYPEAGTTHSKIRNTSQSLNKPNADKASLQSNPVPPPPSPPSVSLPSVPLASEISAVGSHVPYTLETIQEESRSNYTSSTSGGSCNSCASKLTNLSRSSIMSTGQYTEDEIITGLKESGVMNSSGHVNAFSAQTTDFMCQSIPITNTSMYETSSPSPRLTNGNNVTMAGLEYTVLKKLAKGGFATVFLVADAQRPMDSKKVLKVQSPSFLWEVAIVEEVHKRLKANDLADMSQCFMKIDSVSLFTDASITMYDYFHHGTLLDLVNSCSTVTKLQEPIIVFYTLELIRIADALHKCGIIHADIKPDNIILREIRPCTDVCSIQGRGLCLIDFGRAIDVQAFPRGTKFIGSNKTDGFQCVQMIDSATWTYQADLHCIAGTVHVMMFSKYMELTKDSAGLYKPNSTVSRLHDRNMWNTFFSALLNWTSSGTDASQRPDLIEMARPLFDKLQSKMFNKTFFVQFNSLWGRMATK